LDLVVAFGDGETALVSSWLAIVYMFEL
jgi:hypothetical protein